MTVYPIGISPAAVPVAAQAMIGQSPAMQRLRREIRKMARVDAPVMIYGESGTGKELAAHEIHSLSDRSHGPFVAVNCGAIPPSLIQSELFGHEKGAFTSAHKRKIGRVEAANGGTIFLDEIGDLSLELQVNLLRFLQENTIDRVGGTESIPLDIRVIAATHVDLQNAIENNHFREDLYYRLDVLNLKLPLLKNRDEDILMLAEHYLHLFVAEQNSAVQGFTEEAKQLISTYHWPGNIRELVNHVRRAVAMCEHPLIAPKDLGLERRMYPRDHYPTLAVARDKAEKHALYSALRRNRDNVTAAAHELGISRVTAYRLMEKFGMSRH